MSKTLYEELGGKAAMEAASHHLYLNIMNDDRVKGFFDNVDMERQKRKMSSFLTQAFGGPAIYEGQNMRQAHKKAVEKGLNDGHFDAVIECVQKTLIDLGVGESQASIVVDKIESYRDDVLNR